MKRILVGLTLLYNMAFANEHMLIKVRGEKKVNETMKRLAKDGWKLKDFEATGTGSWVYYSLLFEREENK